ncbi:Scn11a [Symbiodinium natans]|uniref:Scn11a protein n=1 Tax=Symbiodinium natans TaxID=878477 RepID=A0A812UT41_9DINO|nr:Scn11a [Symbiodinium natans]
MASAKLLEEAWAARESLLRFADEEHERWLESVMDRFNSIEEAIKDFTPPAPPDTHEGGRTKASGDVGRQMLAIRPTQPLRLAEQADPVPPSPCAMSDFLQLSKDASSWTNDHTDRASPHSMVDWPSGIQDTLQRMISPSADRIVANRLSVVGRPSDTQKDSCWDRLVLCLGFHLNYFAAVVLALNLVFMCLELELQGREVGRFLGAGEEMYDLGDMGPALRRIDVVFDCIYIVELLLRIGLERWLFFSACANWFDTSLVVAAAFDIGLFLFADADDSMMAVAFARAVNTLRAIRLLRIFRLFRGLRILIRACHAFLPTLGWSMVLLGLCMVMSGLLVGSLLQAFLWDNVLALEHKLWVFARYGTAYRSIYTLFEITFAGNWPTNVRPVLENVSDMFVIPFILYITIVTFAALRVITAVFLKDTLEAAANDAEHQVTEKLKRKAQYVEKLEAMFKAIDDTGNGMITEERLNALLSNSTVRAYLETLDLAVPEGTALFHILDNGDGEVTLEEFIDGILRCKGPARAIDQVALHADIRQLDNKLTVAMQLRLGAQDWLRQ